MSTPSRPTWRTFALAALTLALAVPGLPAVAESSAAPAHSAAAAEPGYTVEKTAGITQLSMEDQVEATGSAIFDTRLPWDSHGNAARLGSGATATFDLANSGLTVPADATGMILNVTAVSPTRTGWITVWPSDGARPGVSTLNYAPGTPTANLAVVPVTATRKLTVMNGSTGTTHLLMSFRGWVRSNAGATGAGSVTPTAGARVLDTRAVGTAIAAKGYRDVTVTGHGVPAGAAAALLDVIAVKPTRSGYAVAHPADTARPGTTTVTYRVGSDRAALSLVRLSASGKVRIWNMSSAPVNVVVDSFGWVAAGDSSARPAATAAVQPTRVLDTRRDGSTVGGLDGVVLVPLPTDATPERSGRPSGVVLAITVTGARSAGHLMIDVDGNSSRNPEMLTPSILNFAPGETVTNTTYVTVPSQGTLALTTNGPFVDAIVDLVGVVRHRTEVSGRVVTEADRAPVYPGRVGPDVLNSRSDTVPTGTDGTYWFTRGDLTGAQPMCATATSQTGVPDPTYGVACVGGTKAPAPLPLAVGSRITTDDIVVPRVGALRGVVTRPTGSTTSTGWVSLRRTDGAHSVNVPVSDSGAWSATGIPTGNWVVTVLDVGRDLRGETIDEIPVEQSPTVDQLVSAGATVYLVSTGATTTVEEGQLVSAGRLNWTIVDPDGDYADVRYTVRHESGLDVVSSGNATATTVSRLFRPGGYTVCATQGAVTRCNGNAPSPDTAPLLDVTSTNTNPGVSTTITLP